MPVDKRGVDHADALAHYAVNRLSTMDDAACWGVFGEFQASLQTGTASARGINCYKESKGHMMSQTSILIAEDNRAVRIDLADGLGKAGYAVFEAADGEQALSLARTHHPSLAILDLKMPNTDGLRVGKMLTDDLHVPYIVLSAYDDAQYVREAADNGCLGYVLKPIQIDQLLPLIETALSRAGDLLKKDKQVKNLLSALDADKSVDRAVAFLFTEHHLSAQDAEQFLIRYARDHNKNLRALAKELLQLREHIQAQLRGTLLDTRYVHELLQQQQGRLKIK